MMKEVTYVKLPDGKYKVSITVIGKKDYYKNGKSEVEAEMNDYIDVGVFGKKGAASAELYFKKHKIKSGINTFEVMVDHEPYEAGVDPYTKLIDMNIDDNLKKATVNRK